MSSNSTEDVSKWSVHELRTYLASNNVDTSGCFEKADFEDLARKTMEAKRASAETAPPRPPKPAAKRGTSLGSVDHWSIAELKVFLDNAEQDYSDCLEASDYVSLARRFIDDHPAEAERAAELAQSYPTTKNIEEWSIPELELFLSKAHVDYDDCLEPEDYIKLARPLLEASTASTTTTDGASAAAGTSAGASAAAGESDGGAAAAGAAGEGESGAGKKKEAVDLYAALEIPRDATQAQVTKAYYKLAKRYHPDKNPDNPEAEERFKQISEAYQILSDPEKRRNYDQFGTTSDDMEDPMVLFRMLFGGGRFDDYFATPLAGMAQPGDENKTEEELQAEYQKRHQEMVDGLAIKLSERLQRILETGSLTSSDPKTREFLFAEAVEMSEAPGGAELLTVVGYVYVQMAKQFSSSCLGIPAFFARAHDRGHLLKATFSAIGSAAKMASMGEEAEANPEAAVRQTLKTLWKAGKLEIELTLRDVCSTILAPLQEKKAKAQLGNMTKALKLLGTIFKDVGVKAMREQHVTDFNMPGGGI